MRQKSPSNETKMPHKWGERAPHLWIYQALGEGEIRSDFRNVVEKTNSTKEPHKKRQKSPTKKTKEPHRWYKRAPQKRPKSPTMRHLCDVMREDVITHIQQKGPTTETKEPHKWDKKASQTYSFVSFAGPISEAFCLIGGALWSQASKESFVSFAGPISMNLAGSDERRNTQGVERYRGETGSWNVYDHRTPPMRQKSPSSIELPQRYREAKTRRIPKDADHFPHKSRWI